MSTKVQPVKIFISYAREDEQLREQLEKHLAVLCNDGWIKTWHDRRIGAGSVWGEQITEELESADVILLLISPDFLASDYIRDVELKRALERHEARTARVVPIILRSSMWQDSAISRLQALPRDGVPVSSAQWNSRDEAFCHVAEGIKATIREYTTYTSLDKAIQQIELPTGVIEEAVIGSVGYGRLKPGLSSALGSIHVHVDGGEDEQLARQSVQIIDPSWSRSEIATIVQFAHGPQRASRKDLYLEHTPVKGEEESLHFFSTTVLYEGGVDPNNCELAEIEDKVRLILGEICAHLRGDQRDEGKIVVEAERVVGVVEADGKSHWTLSPSLPAAFASNFTFVKKYASAVNTLYEVHFSVDIPQEDRAEPPLQLLTLVRICAQLGIQVGGWFIFAKTDKWAYRSNMFLDHLDQDKIIEDWGKLNSELVRLGFNYSDGVIVKVIVEESLGVWKTPFEKLKSGLLTVSELAQWEKGLCPNSEFWVVTGNFLGDQFNGVKQAMLRNFEVDVKYVYFLQSFADLSRWLRFRQDLETRHKGCARKMDALVIEFEDPGIWSQELDCFIAWQENEAEGYKLRRNPYSNNIILGSSLTAQKIQEIRSLLDHPMKERRVISFRRLTDEVYIDGAVIWLEFGYVDLVQKERPNEIEFEQFLDEYDGEISIYVSRCGGNVMRGSEEGFVIVLPRSERSEENEVAARAFRLAKVMICRLEDKFRKLGLDAPPYRLVLSYGTMRLSTRSFGRAITGELLRDCRVRAVALKPSCSVALSRIGMILNQTGSPWRQHLSLIPSGEFAIDWSRVSLDELDG